jgi:hypothetical protein
MCMEVVSNSKYELYDSCNQPQFPSTAMALKDIMDDATRTSQKIEYLCENLNSWIAAFETAGVTLPHPGGQPPGHLAELHYEYDGLQLRSDWRVIAAHKVSPGDAVVERRVVIHLPSDGFFHVEASAMSTKKTGVVNEGDDERREWALVEQEVWDQLAPFEVFARQWFEYMDGQKLRHMILYNAAANSLDICLQCPTTLNGIEFSLEPGFPLIPIPDDFWD